MCEFYNVLKLESGQHKKKGRNLPVDKLISIESGGDADHDGSITHGICEGWKGRRGFSRVTQIMITTERNR